MKFIKTVIITLLAMAILFTGIFMAGALWLEGFGFRACEEAAITSVDVSESAVTIKGFYPGSFPRASAAATPRNWAASCMSASVSARYSAFLKRGTSMSPSPWKGKLTRSSSRRGWRNQHLEKEAAAPR